MEKTTNDLKNIIKFLLCSLFLVLLLNFLVTEILRMVRMMFIPTPMAIAILLVILFRKQLFALVKGGSENEEK